MSKLIREILLTPMPLGEFLKTRKSVVLRKDPPPPKARKPSITYQHFVRKNLEERGWTLHHTGWPDFFCTKPDGSFMLIEAKNMTEKLHPAQKRMRSLFRRHLSKTIYIARANENGYIVIGNK